MSSLRKDINTFESMKDKFTNEEMLEYVQSLYRHEGVAPMVENIETPCNTCIDLEYVNRGTKKRANGKV